MGTRAEQSGVWVIMSTVTLNLSRKWRSQNFDQLVGQSLAVRILKNSLYRGHYFPVYLFSGQRGCGKTSTARIFAAAVNCTALVNFQKDPQKVSIPCLVCDSCNAMRDGSHPDFVEIDAASHTGVDNIRSIIESSSLLPLIGRKRVYLIDEAHMLSKAAFNAALKILEEPPSTALFILATTNQHKIIDTVRSRCFQLFFVPISHDPLRVHLQLICKKEKIAYTDEALDCIVQHSEGSARDALNILEQVRFANSMVTKEFVLTLFGHVSDQQIFDIIRCVIHGDATPLIRLLHGLHIDNHKAEFIWQRMVLVLRVLIWRKHGVDSPEVVAIIALCESDITLYSLVDLHHIIEALYTHEELFSKTAMQYIFLEMILVKLCYKNKKDIDDNDGSAPCSLKIASVIDNIVCGDSNDEQSTDEVVISYDEYWLRMVTEVEKLNDALLYSLFKQAQFINYDQISFRVSIELSKDLILFKEWLENSQEMWQPLLRKIFSPHAALDTQFIGINKISKDKIVIEHNKEKISHIPRSQEQQAYKGNRYNSKIAIVSGIQKNESRIDVSDESVWKTASMLLRHFPGVITEIRENR